MPPGLRFVYVNLQSGKPAPPGAPGVILEAFKPAGERALTNGDDENVVTGDDQDGQPPDGARPSVIHLGPGTGGLY
jgi:penicillin-binding protein 1A